MSCDYCTRTGEPAAQTGGLGRTHSRARWSAGRTDVQAWFEERRRQGAGRPAVVAALPPAPAVAAPGPRIHYGCPATAADAATCINCELAMLTRHKFGVEAVAGKDWVCIESQEGHELTETEMRLLREVGISEALAPLPAPPRLVLQPGAWRRWAVRLQVLETAQRLMPQFFPCQEHAQAIFLADEVLLTENVPGPVALVTRRWMRVRVLSAAGIGTNLYGDEAGAIGQLVRMRQNAATLYCPLCGRHILGAPRGRTCGACASADQMV